MPISRWRLLMAQATTPYTPSDVSASPNRLKPPVKVAGR
jgi:hypothetical protein